MTEASTDPLAHVPEGRLEYASDEGGVEFDVDRYRRRVTVLGGLCVGALVFAGAAAAWEAIAFARRGSGDVRITTQSEEVFGSRFGQTRAADYADRFLVRAEGPFLLAMVVCMVAFVAWLVIVDRVARLCGDAMDSKRWQAVWGWFVPIANLIFPYRCVRELTEVHGAERARRLVAPWWLLWAVGLLVNAFVLNSSSASVSGEVGQLDASPQAAVHQLNNLDRYHVFAACCFTVDALLAIALVSTLTTRVRWRLTPDEE